MFGIALSASACLRAGTRVDIAWIVDRSDGEAFDPAEAVAITPGGGRLGSLLSGALDGQLIERAGLHADGRLVRLDVSAADAAVAGVSSATGISCLLVPGSTLPDDLWDRLLAREAVCLVTELDGDSVVRSEVYTAESIAAADDGAQRLFEMRTSATEVTEHRVTTSLWPRAGLVIVGGGEVADSLAGIAGTLGWHAVTTRDANEASGLIAATASLDSVVVLGHDLELTGRALMAALSSGAGYVGAVGPRRLHDTRADWLAYRGQTDLSRLRAPAGLDIGARTPQEVALAVAAEIVSSQASRGRGPARPGTGADEER